MSEACYLRFIKVLRRLGEGAENEKLFQGMAGACF
jgi:hypothetical protein